MKKLIWLLLLYSCTKSGYKPDYDQTTCKRVTYWQQDYSDKVGGVPISDSTIQATARFCTSEYLYGLEVPKAEHFEVQWVPVCNSGGETLHYIRMWSIVKDE